MTGTRCSNQNFCAFDDVGAMCTGKGQCNDTCAAGPGANYCTAVCYNGGDCPAGWGCSQPMGGTRVCLKLDVYCTAGEQCAGQACDTNMLASGCTMQCTSASDCPQRDPHLLPWSCSQFTSGTYCSRPGDVYGPLYQDETEAFACSFDSQNVTLCGDGLAVTPVPSVCPKTDVVYGTEKCVSTCRLQGGCGYGFACVNGLAGIGPSSTPVAICVQTGFAEVGQTCSKNENCLFGLCNSGKCSRDCSGDNVCPSGFQCSGGMCM